MKKFIEGHDVLTGNCILPATHDFLCGAYSQSFVVAVSPLYTLMKDQVRAMEERDIQAIQAVFVGDGCEEEGAVDVCNGKFQLVAPEALLTSEGGEICY